MQFRKKSKAKQLNSPQTIQRLEIIWLEYLVGVHVTLEENKSQKNVLWSKRKKFRFKNLQ